jgi:hypothetical protein
MLRRDGASSPALEGAALGIRAAPRLRLNARRTSQLGLKLSVNILNKLNKTFNNGSLGSGIDEERSEMR